MTETETEEADPESLTSESTNEKDAAWYFHRAALAVIVVLAVYVGFQFYWSTTAAINVWVPRDLVHLFKAVFNLALLLTFGAAAIHELRRINE